MGISNQIPNSRLAQAGVIANAGERPASPYEGMVVFQKDTNQTLVWDGSAWVYLSTSTANPPGLELITTSTVSSAGGTAATVSNGVITIGSGNTSVTITCFTSGYTNYKLVCNGLYNSTQSIVTVTLGSTTTAYYSAEYYDLVGGGTTGNAYMNNGAYWRIMEIGTQIGENSFSMDMYGPNTTANRKSFTCQYFGANFNGHSGGQLVNGQQYTSIKFAPFAGSFSGGTIRVYGYRD